MKVCVLIAIKFVYFVFPLNRSPFQVWELNRVSFSFASSFPRVLPIQNLWEYWPPPGSALTN